MLQITQIFKHNMNVISSQQMKQSLNIFSTVTWL